MDYINVQVVEWLPISIKGLSTMNNDDGFTIILNGKHSAETLCATYIHEVNHIRNKDFNSVLSADALEKLRHGDNNGY